jgi:hypothetical protein
MSAMKNCDYCGRENEDTVDRCRECGTRFSAPITSEVSQVPSPNLTVSPWSRRIPVGVFCLALLGLVSAALGSVLLFGTFLWAIVPVLLCFWYSKTSKRTSASSQVGIRVIWTVFAIISFILALVMPYCEGRTNSLWIVPPTIIPADILPMFWLFLSCIVLFVLCIRSLLARRHVMITSLMFLVSLLFFCSWFKVRPADIFQRGFNNYAKNVLTAEEWRSIAKFAQTNLPPEGMLPGPRKNLWDVKENGPLWSALCAVTQIQKLDPSLTIYAHTGQTEIVWGGTLVGHRGVIVFASKADAAQDPSNYQTSFIADDIVTFISSD